MSGAMDVVRLEVVAAKAKQLAEDLKTGRLYPGDLDQGITEMMQQLEQISRSNR